MSEKIDFFKNNKKESNINDIFSVDKRMRKMSRFGSKTRIPSAPPKRRGRRPKKVLESLGDIQDNVVENVRQNNSAVILKLPLNPSRMPKMNNKNVVTNFNVESESDKDDSSDGMFKNDIPHDVVCAKCCENEKTIKQLKQKLEKYEKKEKINKSNKIYNNELNFICFTSGKKIMIKKTNIKCWWDCNNFTNLPFFLPELFHNNTYHVRGCFCSFNCALAYNLYYLKDSRIYHRKSLVYNLYKEIYGSSTEEITDIREAPPKEILKDFGGEISINTYRESFIMMNKEYVVYIPPLKPICVTIEERNINTEKNDDDNEFVIKRSRPLSKRRSVLSSMRNQANYGDQ